MTLIYGDCNSLKEEFQGSGFSFRERHKLQCSYKEQKAVCCVIQQVETRVTLEGCQSEALHKNPNTFVFVVGFNHFVLLPQMLCSIFQGAKIIQSFMWYLNPRQVFDLTKGGPREGYVHLHLS